MNDKTAPTTRPALGERVLFSDILYRSRKHAGSKIWERFYAKLPIRKGPQCRAGVYMGYRTLQDGQTEYDLGEAIWCPSAYKEAWLIVVNPRQNPYKVLPEDVTRLECEQ